MLIIESVTDNATTSGSTTPVALCFVSAVAIAMQTSIANKCSFATYFRLIKKWNLGSAGNQNAPGIVLAGVASHWRRTLRKCRAIARRWLTRIDTYTGLGKLAALALILSACGNATTVGIGFWLGRSSFGFVLPGGLFGAGPPVGSAGGAHTGA